MPEDHPIDTLLKIVLALAVTLIVCMLATLVAVAMSVLSEGGFDAEAEAVSEDPWTEELPTGRSNSVHR